MSTETPTPISDAIMPLVRARARNTGIPVQLSDVERAIAVARRLERERDEARRDRDAAVTSDTKNADGWAVDGSQRDTAFRESAELRKQRDEARAEASELREKLDKLAAFKTFVHRRLDEGGVPSDPKGEHAERGCRVGQRLKWLFDERDQLRERVERLREALEYIATDCPAVFMEQAARLALKANGADKALAETEPKGEA